jgi:hypothetical protein
MTSVDDIAACVAFGHFVGAVRRVGYDAELRTGGRPQIQTELRVLIRQMSIENPLWGAPRIHFFVEGRIHQPVELVALMRS